MVQDQIYRAYKDEITWNKKILSLFLKSLWKAHKYHTKTTLGIKLYISDIETHIAPVYDKCIATSNDLNS